MPPKSPLQAAVKGGPLTERQSKNALGDAVRKIASLSRRAQSNKEAMVETGTMVVHTAETQGSLFLASLAEGYFGDERLKIGSVDVRAPLGLAAQGYGLYEAMSGGKAGGHALAIGNGVLGSWLASVATQAGRALAEKRAGTLPPPTMLQGNLVPAMPLLPEPDLQGGPVREVLLTPDDEMEGWTRRPRRHSRRPHPPRRSRQTWPDEDDPTEETD